MAEVMAKQDVWVKEGQQETDDSGHATEEEDLTDELDVTLDTSDLKPEDEKPSEQEIVWGNVVKFVILHSLALYGLTLLPSISLPSWVFLFLTYQFSGAGITAGAHRLWAHRAYKATPALKVFLLVANSMAGENSVYVWSRDHRLHHKCSETQADPHNANRGFFFSHMGWLMVRKHPAVMKAGKTINMSDLEADSLLMFQHRHYLKCFLMAGFVLPTIIPNLLWGESLTNAYFMAVIRYVAVLHFTWLVNSAAHMFGMKPYDKNIGPSENRLVSVLAMGEGFHNYHHTFPYDYGTSEWGFRLNVTTRFINTMAKLGFAYDLRTASPSVVAARAARTGNPELTRQGMAAKKLS